ncbi:CD109 antigen-like [Haliotis asinina]|uniref:CD109 antigen-like n=1 Tax=Haliotis asinina TaxID=109174 RepID=UPI00353253E3
MYIVCILLVALSPSCSARNQNLIFLVPDYIEPGRNFSVEIHSKDNPWIIPLVGQIKTAAGELVSSKNIDVSPETITKLELKVPPTITEDKTYIFTCKSTTQRIKVESLTPSPQLVYRAEGFYYLIQTDKYIYKGGQTVRFRVIGLNQHLIPHSAPLTVTVKDPKGQKVELWNNLMMTGGVLSQTFDLGDEVPFGTWSITASDGVNSTTVNLKVMDYYLPTYEVQVEFPQQSKFVVLSDDFVHVKVTARYVFGKDVEGNVSIIGSLKSWDQPQYYGQTLPAYVSSPKRIKGSATFDIPMSDIRKMGKGTNAPLSSDSLYIDAYVTEDGITMNGSSAVVLYDSPIGITIMPVSKFFRPGMPFDTQILIQQSNGDTLPAPLSKGTLTTTINGHASSNMFTPVLNGFNTVRITVPSDAISLNVKVAYQRVSKDMNVYSFSGSEGHFLEILPSSQEVKADDWFNVTVLSNHIMPDLKYRIVVRQEVFDDGVIATNRKSSLSTQFHITPDMFPDAYFIFYYFLPDGGVVADGVRVNVASSDNNELHISFQESEVLPGGNITLTVSGAPGTTVYLMAVDKSVLILGNENEITKSRYKNLLLSNDVTVVDVDNSEELLTNTGMSVWIRKTDINECFTSPPCLNGGTCVDEIPGFTCYCPVPYTGQRCELKLDHIGATPYPGYTPLPGATPDAFMHLPISGIKVFQKTRTRANFPENLLWKRITIGPTGKAEIPVHLGDTLTTWVASAFGLSSKYGLSISSEHTQVKTFLTFFVSLTVPDHIVFGEQILLQPQVYNYMGTDVPVTLVVKNSKNQNEVYRSGKISQGGSLSFIVPVTVSSLGIVKVTVTAVGIFNGVSDSVEKEIVVKPQGAPQQYNLPVVLDLNSAQSVVTTLDIALPPSVIQESVTIKAKLSGDIMAPSISGLSKLVTFPTGCGEQTMIRLSPDIYIFRYLNSTGQMTSSDLQKLSSYIKQGYQHELLYQLKDGSFATFTTYSIGSTWLTAFVVKSFMEASDMVYISDDVIVRAVDWILAQQNFDGSFPEKHALYHKYMQGGVKSAVALAAYVSITLGSVKNLEYKTQRSISDAQRKVLHYLTSQLNTLDENHAHALAISAYALTLARSSLGDIAMNKLQAISHQEGDVKFWTATKTTSFPKRQPWSRQRRFSSPIDIETTAYVLLSHVVRGELGEGLKVMKWIVRQRNPNGGFTSTQDTVIALDALSSFHTSLHKAAKQTTAHGTNIAATVATGGVTKHVTMDNTNKDVLHELQLPGDSKTVSVSATGSGLGIIEVGVFYNVNVTTDDAAFDLTASITKQTVDAINVRICTRWLLSGSSGMAVIQAGIPTGFQPDVEVITNLPSLKRKEYNSGNVDLYFEEIGSSQVCVDIRAVRVGMTLRTQKSLVVVFDYYNPANQKSVFYISPELQNAKLCDVCTDCDGCGNLIVG